MPVTIDATPGGANANAYCDVTFASSYMNNRLNASAFTSAAPDDQARALIQASIDISNLEGAWEGQRATIPQALSWPRQFAIDPDYPQILAVADISQLYYPLTVVPDRVKNATCELALEYLRAGSTDVSSIPEDDNKQSKSVGPLQTTFIDSDKRAHGLARYPRVMAFLSPLFDPGQTGGLKVIRV